MEENCEKKIPVALAPFNGLLIAISFMTRIPVKPMGFDDLSWKWSTAFFPFCGFLIGSLAVTPLIATLTVSAPMNNMALLFVTPIYYIIICAWLTRLLHLDGFCDCCDAFSAMTTKNEDRLGIMKDPHVGSSATGAAVILYISKAQILYLMVSRRAFIEGDVTRVIMTLVAIPVIARLMVLCLAAFSKYPREKGTAKTIVGNVPWYSLLVGLLTLVPLMIINSPFLHQYRGKSLTELILFLLINSRLVLPICLSILVTMYWRIKANDKLGGVTGDVLGACCETVEVAAGLGFLLTV